MTAKTKIEWTDSSWNPVTGCSKVSPGCDHCYAETIAHRFAGTKAYPNDFDVTLHPERLDQPLRWKKPRRVFVNSMSDLFHADIPDGYIAQVWAVMAAAPQHTFQVLTKRPGRMRSMLSSLDFDLAVAEAWSALGTRAGSLVEDHTQPYPLRNVWLGVSAENQKWADVRVPMLLDTPAAVRFVSAEPLLGPIGLCNCYPGGAADTYEGAQEHCNVHGRNGLDWVIVGGESGPGARPMHPAWVRSIRDRCVEAGVPFHFKQRGEWTWNELGEFQMPQKPLTNRVAVMHPSGMTALTKPDPFDPVTVGHPNWATRVERVGKRLAGRDLDGRTWDEFPGGTQSPPTKRVDVTTPLV